MFNIESIHLENILVLNSIKPVHHQGFTQCHRATFPNFLCSQLFPFFTLPCPFLSVVKKNTLPCHMSFVQLFPSADSCQVLGSSLSIASRGLFTKIVCHLLPEVLAGKEGSPLVLLDACLSPPRHWGPLENRDDEKN